LEWQSSTILTIALALIVSGSLIAVGTVHAVTLVFVAPAALLTGIFAIWVEDDPSRRFPRPAWVIVFLGLYSLLQSLPLPMGLLSSVSPVAARTWQDAFSLTGSPLGQPASVSVEPGASRLEALKWLTYAAVFVASARLARERSSPIGLIIVVGSALFSGVLSVAHGLAQVEEWLFIYRPQFARPPWAIAPLLNPNNFAGYLNLALFSAMGLLFASKPKIPRMVTAATIVLLAALVILTGSRGGVLALVVGFFVSGVAFRIQQVRSSARSSRTIPGWIPIVGVAIAAIGLAVIGLTDVVWEQLLDETTGKLRIIEYSQAITKDHLWFGIGRGAFGTAYAAYRQELGDNIFRYAENFVVQWIVEWGLPVALAGLVALLVTLWPSRHGFGKNAQQTAVFIAVGILLLQNLVDLATEIPSVAIATFALLGTAHGTTSYLRDRRHRRTEEVNHSSQTFRATTMVVPCLAASCLLVWFVAKTSLPDAIAQRFQLSATFSLLVGKPKGSAAFATARKQVTSALLRFPADPYIPLIGALLTRESGQNPYQWLNQALRRDPLSPRPHLLLAETLEARGNLNQALFELKLTAKYAPYWVSVLAERAVRWSPDYKTALRAVPDGIDGSSMLTALAQQYGGAKGSREVKQQLFELALERNPSDVNTNFLVANDLFSWLDGDMEPCRGTGRASCLQRLDKHAKVVIDSRKETQLSVIMQAKRLAFDKKFDEAERFLQERCGILPDPASCNLTRVTYAQHLSEPSRFDDAAMAYTSSACTTAAGCASAYNWLGNIHLSHNSPMLALSKFERAAEELPTAEAWLLVAQIAAQVGRYGRAETALSTARRLGGKTNTTDLEKRLSEIRRAKMLEELKK
jgi:tetratricopeptide (TPR) repeat protein